MKVPAPVQCMREGVEYVTVHAGLLSWQPLWFFPAGSVCDSSPLSPSRGWHLAGAQCAFCNGHGQAGPDVELGHAAGVVCATPVLSRGCWRHQQKARSALYLVRGWRPGSMVSLPCCHLTLRLPLMSQAYQPTSAA